MSNLLRNKPLDVVLASAPYVILGIGFIIRLKILIQNRSLFIDEASLARNLCERGYAEFFTSLSYEQYAPPLFMVESKLMVQLFGNHEWAMRLIPFIAGLGTMWVLWLLLQEWVSSPVVRIYGLSLFCFSFLAIRYGTEFKQYSGDAFLAAVFVWLAMRDRNEAWNARKGLQWAFVGSLGIWYSMPLVFTLSGVGIYFMWLHGRNRFLGVGVAIGAWLLSFCVYYFLLLRHDIGSEYLENYFDVYFLNVFSLSGEVWANNFNRISELFRNVTDKSVISIGFGLLSFLIGSYQLIRTDRAKAFLLLLPIVALLVASILHYYNLMARLTLVIFPAIIIVICIGVDKLWASSQSWLKIVLGVLVVFGIFNKKGLEYFSEEMIFEEIKPCLKVMKNQLSPADIIYVDHEALPAFEFYQKNYEHPYDFQNEVVRGNWDTSPAEVIRDFPQQNIWLLYSHALESEINRNVQLLEDGPIETVCHSERVRLFTLHY